MVWWASPLRLGIGWIVSESTAVNEQWCGVHVLEVVELACCVVVTVTVAVVTDGCASDRVVV